MKKKKKKVSRRFTLKNITKMHKLYLLNVTGLGKSGLGRHFYSTGDKSLDRNVGNEGALRAVTC